MAQRSSRKRRKQRQRQRAAKPATEAAPRGYAASRAKDEATRAALKPLAEGERPTAVTVGAIAAAALALANLVALIAGYDPDKPNETIRTLLISVVLAVTAFGMWRARYWAVLGMQTLLALTLVLSALALALGSYGALQAVGLVAIFAGAGALFWFLVKAMARIQMPERPGSRP